MRQCTNANAANMHARLKKIIGQVQAVDRMIRIVQCPFTKQNLLQMFPADPLFINAIYRCKS